MTITAVRPPATNPRRRSPQRSSRTHRPSTGLALVAPSAVIVGALFVVPLAILVWMSFTDYPLLGAPQWVGTQNYRDIPANDLFTGAIRFTVLYTVLTTVVLFAVSFLLVWISNAPRRGARFYRTAFFLPYVVGTAAAALMWFVNVNDQVGIFAQILRMFGIENPELLGTPAKATATTVLLVVWKFIGFQVVVLLVGLQAVPDELYEAARMDGAGAWSRLRYITVPLLKPTLALLLILSITGSLLAFDQFVVLTGGGPDRSTVTLVMAIYNTAFNSFQLGSAASLSIVLLVALVALNTVQLLILRRRDDS